MANPVDIRAGITGNFQLNNFNSGQGASATAFWRGDGTWNVPANFTSGAAGYAPASGGGTTNFLRADGTWAAPPNPTQNFLYLGTVSVSSGAIADTTIVAANASTYRSLMFVLNSVLPGTNAVSLLLQVHNSGAFKNTGYISAAATTTGIALTNTTNGGNTAPGMSGHVIASSLSGSPAKIWAGSVAWLNNAGAMATFSPGGFWNSTGAIDGFQIVASSGTFTSGSVDIYGML